MDNLEKSTKVDPLIFSADKKCDDMEFDKHRWDQIIDNLLLLDDQKKTFEKGFKEQQESEKVSEDILATVKDLMVPTDAELKHLALIF